MDLAPFRVTGQNNPGKQVSVDRWNSLLSTIQAGAGAAVDDEVADDAPTAGIVTRSAQKIGALITAALATSTRVGVNRSAVASTLLSSVPVYLMESGRRGFFAFDDSDLSAKVTADTRQAVYIAPSSDTSGASGAWVRQYDGDLQAKWFGLAADDTTDDAPALNAALLLAKAKAASFTYIEGGPAVRIDPSAKLYCASTITMQKGVGLVGGGRSLAERSQIRFAADTHGVSVLAMDSEGAGPNAQGAFIHGVKLKGGFADGVHGEGEFHGINAETTFDARDIYIEGFQGDGIHLEATSAASNSYSQQGNCFTIRNVFISSCRDCIFLEGSDTNAGIVDKASLVYARRFGLNDRTFIGGHYQAIHTDGCGSTAAYTGVAVCGVTYSDKRYSVKLGQEDWASLNPPTGTTADNQGWYYCFDGVSGNPAWPDWVSGIELRAGGPFFSWTASTFIGCYSEDGQPISQFDNGGTVVIGGNAHKFKGYGTALWNDQGRTRLGNNNRGLIVDGDLTVTGPNNGGADVTINGQVITFDEPGGVYPTSLRFKLGGGADLVAFSRVFNQIYMDSVNGGYVRASTGANNLNTLDTVFSWWLYGLNIGAGKRLEMNGTVVIDPSRNATMASYNTESGGVYKVNGTQVVGAQGAAVSADATDLASVITLSNELKARLRTHGLVA